jgi:hypothetical protein
VLVLVMIAVASSFQEHNGELDARTLDFETLSAQELSQYLLASRSRVRACISCFAHSCWLGRSIILVRVLHSLISLRDCDGEDLQGRACACTTRLIAEMPYIEGDEFCLAALLAVPYIKRSPKPARVPANSL